MSHQRILIAGIGNIFLGDDAFGVEVARRLSARQLPDEVRVADFGIRGFDLAYALLEGYETVIMVDAAPRGDVPGTLYLMEPQIPKGAAAIDTHAMDPVKVLRMASATGDKLPHILLVGCEPAHEQPDMNMGMSAAVQLAIGRAADLIESLVHSLLTSKRHSEIAPSLDVNHA